MDLAYIKDNLDRYFILFMDKELEKNKNNIPNDNQRCLKEWENV